MKNIYKIIWNVSTQCWVVVSELAKSNRSIGKCKKAVIVGVIGGVLTIPTLSFAACVDSTYASATAGSSCTASSSSYVYVNSSNSSLNFNSSDVYVASGNASVSSGSFTVSNGGAVTMEGNLTVTPTVRYGVWLAAGSLYVKGNLIASPSSTMTGTVSRAVHMGSTGSVLNVDGDMTLTTDGITSSSANAAAMLENSSTNSTLYIAGKTTIKAATAVNDAIRLYEGTNTFNGGLSIYTSDSVYRSAVRVNGNLSTDAFIIINNGLSIDHNGAGDAWYQTQDTSTISGGTSISTSRDSSNALLVSGGSWTATGGVTLTTTGASANGISIKGTGTITIDDLSINTVGDSANGISATATGVITTTDSTAITTTGNSAAGIYAVEGGSVTVANTTINTSGDSASAVVSKGSDSLVSIGGGEITATGADSVAAEIGGSSTLTVNNSILTSSQLVSLLSQTTSGNTATANISNSELVASTASSIEVNGDGVSSITLTGSQAITNNGTWLDVVDSVRSTVTLDNTSVTGAAIKERASISNVVLNNNSVWTVTGNSTVTNLTNNDSSIIFDSTDASSVKTITVEGDYTGTGGSITFNTVLNSDSSATDKLIIEGNASGSTLVSVNNLGGVGAATIEGIQLIEVDGTSTDNAFTKNGRIVAGSYEYSLAKGNTSGTDTESWYLTSKYIDDNDKKTDDSVVRPEAGAYIANLASANTLFNTTLHDRLGETQYTDLLTGEKLVTSMWIRSVVGQNRFAAGHGQLKNRTNWSLVQLGGDIAQWSSNDTNRLHLGVMAGYGRSNSHTDARLSGYSANGNIDGYSLGLYGTWYDNDADKSGLYVDSWVLWNHFNAKVHGQELSREKYKLKGITASIESGYTFKLGGSELYNYWLQPKAQVTYMGVAADNHTESNGTKVKADANNWQSRLGVRLSANTNDLYNSKNSSAGQLFIEANWLHNTQPFSVKMDDSRISQDGARNIAEIKTGVEANILTNTNVWFNLNYQRGDHDYRNLGAMLGVKYSF